MLINKNVVHREIAGEHILVPVGETALRYSGIFSITEVGAKIWEMLRDGKDIPDITAALLETYDVEKDVLEKDIDDFLQMLRENELILE
ncbi:MAG: PqqD family protein [Clostridia bacterium]|nr:PqqD family protein [Clostridia bacterium]